MCFDWIARSNRWCEQRYQTDDQHHEDASEPDLVLSQPPPYSPPRPPRLPWLRLGCVQDG
jgi:hypothetical protein